MCTNCVLTSYMACIFWICWHNCIWRICEIAQTTFQCYQFMFGNLPLYAFRSFILFWTFFPFILRKFHLLIFQSKAILNLQARLWIIVLNSNYIKLICEKATDWQRLILLFMKLPLSRNGMNVCYAPCLRYVILRYFGLNRIRKYSGVPKMRFIVICFFLHFCWSFFLLFIELNQYFAWYYYEYFPICIKFQYLPVIVIVPIISCFRDVLSLSANLMRLWLSHHIHIWK